MAYLDDILIYCRTENEHLEILDNAFKCLLKARLKIKLSKCSFFKEQIHYLGHLVSGMSILPLANKIEALMKLWPPTTVKDVIHFLRLKGYYLKFICNYTDIAFALNCLTHKAQPFMWTLECQASFSMLWSRLTNTLNVQLPDPNKPFYCSWMPANFVIQMCLPMHPLQTPMKHLWGYSLVRLHSQVLSHKHRTCNFHPVLSIL